VNGIPNLMPLMLIIMLMSLEMINIPLLLLNVLINYLKDMTLVNIMNVF